MKCRRPLYHRSGEQDDGTRRCGEVMRRGAHNGGVCMALLVPGFLQHLKEVDTIAHGRSSMLECQCQCQDGGVIRMAALSLRSDTPPFFNPSCCPSAILFPRRRLLLFGGLTGPAVATGPRWTSRTAWPGGAGRGRIRAAASRACLCEDRVYRQSIVPRAPCPRSMGHGPLVPSTRPCPKRSDVSSRVPGQRAASVWSGSRAGQEWAPDRPYALYSQNYISSEACRRREPEGVAWPGGWGSY